MRLRPHVVRTLVLKDVARLLHNAPALMLLGLLVTVAFLVASSGLVEEETAAASSSAPAAATRIVYWNRDAWVEHLERSAPPELGIQFVEASAIDPDAYAPNDRVIELRPLVRESGGLTLRRHVQYRHPGTDPSVLWPAARWFLSASIAHFGKMPPLFETILPIAPPSGADQAKAALERVSIADVLSVSLVGTVLLTTVLFFSACGLLVSLTAQERERGVLRALLLTPATYFEFVLAKGFVHGVLALGCSALVVAALKPAALSSLVFWSTMVALTCGYFAVGLLIASFAKNQAAPNLLSFAYLLVIGTLNLLGSRFDAFRFLSSLTFERYGLLLTVTSLNHTELDAAASLSVLRSPAFRMLTLLAAGLLLIATFVGSRKIARD